MNLNPEHGIAVFTDGSAYSKDGSGGWAWVAIDAFGGTDSDSGSTSQTTNNQMELYAVSRALDTLDGDYGPQSILVYSDSEYVVLGASDKTRKRNKNKLWWQALDQYIARHELVVFEHIRGHQGHKYNELADRLAGEARKKGKESRYESTDDPEG